MFNKCYMIISILKMTWATYLFKTPRLFKTLEYYALEIKATHARKSHISHITAFIYKKAEEILCRRLAAASKTHCFGLE